MVFSASAGAFFAVLLDSKTINMGIGIGVGCVLYLIQEYMMTYVYKIHNPQLWVYGLMMMGIIGICAYFLLDL